MRLRRTWSAIPVLLAATLIAGGCGDDATRAASSPPVATTVATATTTTVVVPAFPVTINVGQGDVTIKAKPLRIVSLSAALTEMLYSVDAGAQVVAVDHNSNFPAGTPTTDLSGLKPNVEAIAKFEPDLVVVSSDRNGIVSALGAVGITTLLLPSAVHVEDVYREIDAVGAATGHSDKAATVVAAMRTDLDAIVKSAPQRTRPVRYFYELDNVLHSATSDTFIGELLRTIGLVSIADAAGSAAGGYPQLSNEYVLDANPDVILLAHTDGSAEEPSLIKARPGWSKLQAVQNDRVVALNVDIAARWGPRIVDLLRAVVDATKGLAT